MTRGAISSGAPGSLWPPLVACAVAAIAIDFSSIHRAQHADSFLYALISLYRWTPFIWEQNRVGMLVPLLATPIKNPLFNLLAQDAVYIFAGLAAPVLLARYMLRNATFATVGLLSAAGLVAFTPRRYCFEYLVDTQYGVWLSLGLAGLILLEALRQRDDDQRPTSRSTRWLRAAAACSLIALAHWVYCTAAMFLGALVVCRALLVAARVRRRANHPAQRDRPALTASANARSFAERKTTKQGSLRQTLQCEAAIAIAVLAGGFGVGMLLMRLTAAQDTRFTALPLTDWPDACRRLAGTTWHALAPQWWPCFLVGAALIGLGATLKRPMRRSATHAWRSAVALLAAAALLALFLATRQWVRDNQYNLRYLLPSAIFAATALTAVAVAPWCDRQAGEAFSTRASGMLLLLAAWFAYGGPSLAATRRALAGDSHLVDARGAPVDIRADDVVASGCTHIAGGYWRVWPAVFRANWMLYEQGDARVVWGVTERSGPTSARFQSVPRRQTRIGVFIGGDDKAHLFLDHYRFYPVGRGEAYGSIALFKPVDETAGGSPSAAPDRHACKSVW